MFKKAIDSKFYARDKGYQDLGDPIDVLAFFQGPSVKIVGFTTGQRRYKVLSQNLSYQKEIGQYVWLCYSVSARDKSAGLDSTFTLLFNPATREWRLNTA